MVLKIDKDLEIWFLVGSQSLYGVDTLQQVAEQSQEVARTLDAASQIPVRVIWKPILKTPEAIKEICLAASSDSKCIGVIVWMHTFSPAKMWIAGLLNLCKPLLHLHTQVNSQLPWSFIDMDFMNLNQAAHGDREHGHIQARLNAGRKIIVGHYADPTVITRVASWIRATIGWDTSQNLKLARFGDNMRSVAVTDGDKVGAQIQFGISVEAYGINALVDAVDSVTNEEVDALVIEYLDSYNLVDSLKPNGEQHESLRYAASQEAGLRNFLSRGGFSAFTTNFEDLGGLRQLPGIAVQRLMAEGYGFGGEGDWKTSALLRIIKSMGVGLEGGTSFMEDYTYHFGPGEPKVLGAHMLEVCPTLTSQKINCEIHPLGIGNREDPVRLVFDATPAQGLVISLTDTGDRFRMIANVIEVVKPDEPLLNLPVARAVWKPEPSLSVSAESWIYAGGSHHTVLTTAIEMETIQDFAEIAGVELLTITFKTDPLEFRQQVRWNSTHFRLSTRA
jgi:L-arabinose isomerase